MVCKGIWSDHTIAADFGALPEDSVGLDLSAGAYLHAALDNYSVCADEFDTVFKVLLDHCSAGYIVKFQQVFSVVCAENELRIGRLESSCLLAFAESYKYSICKVVFLLNVVVIELAEKVDKVSCPEPVSAGVYLFDTELFLACILLLNYTADAGSSSSSEVITVAALPCCL